MFFLLYTLPDGLQATRTHRNGQNLRHFVFFRKKMGENGEPRAFRGGMISACPVPSFW